MALATFGAGCFWGVEAALCKLRGVLETAVGYMGGEVDSPTYEQVCTDTTGHAEVVQVTFDPDQVAYDALLDVFFKCHDPTQVNRQGPDVGRQYRSVVFFHDAEQKTAARMAIDAITVSGEHTQPLATEVVPATTFWRGEEYHQQYLEKRGLGSCHLP